MLYHRLELKISSTIMSYLIYVHLCLDGLLRLVLVARATHYGKQRVD